MYDEIDMQASYRTGFWIGAVSGCGLTFILCLVIGILVN